MIHPITLNGRQAVPNMELFEDNARLHLSCFPKTGRTTFCLQQAREHIRSGNRVIWGSENTPDNIRFSQIFSELDISAASRFHAMNTGGEFGRALKEISRASGILPGVSLVVIDDWTPIQGRPEKERISAVKSLNEEIDDECIIILTSSAYSDASGVEQLKAKGAKELEDIGYSTCYLIRENDDSRRILKTPEKQYQLLLEESGFKQV